MKIILSPYLQEKTSEEKCELLQSVIDNYVAKTENYTKPGYDDFCKLMFIPNESMQIRPSHIRLRPWVYQYIETSYNTRREGELPVLIQRAVVLILIPPAKFIFVVLYDKEQSVKENSELKEVDFDYSVVHISGQNHDIEYPMLPITMMRNALGIEFGGSGVPIDTDKYYEAVEFYKNYIHLCKH